MEFSEGGPKVDKIPEGAFLSGDYDPERVAAVRRVISIGSELTEAHPEAADLYRTTDLTYLQIAERLIPDVATQYPDVASKAVGFAVRNLIPEEEQKEITARRRSQLLQVQTGQAGSEEFLDHQRAAAQKRHEQHGVDTEAMIRGRGRIPWTQEERNLVFELSTNPEFQHKSGNKLVKGAPNYSNIAFAVNEVIHKGEEVRHGNSVGSMVRDSRRTKG